MTQSLWSDLQRNLWVSAAHTVISYFRCSLVLAAAVAVFRCSSLLCNNVTRLLLDRCAPLSLWLTHTCVQMCMERVPFPSSLPEYPSTPCWWDRNFPVLRRGGPCLTHGAEWEGSWPVLWTASCFCWSGLPRPAVITGAGVGQPEHIQFEVMLPQ